MKKFEYLIQNIASADEENVLRMLGGKGWQLVFIVEQSKNSIAKIFYFIREKTNG